MGMARSLRVRIDAGLTSVARMKNARSKGPATKVLVLGATSAIAAEVVRLYAARGARLHLVGRTEAKLAEVVASASGAEVTWSQADFGAPFDGEALVRDAIATLGGLDVVLVAHGDLGDQLESERSYAHAEEIFRVNLLSVVALLIPIANHLEERRAGTIAVITSVAGERGRPRNFTYGAAKGALNVYLEGLRSRLYPSGVVVTTLKLGPVDTPMTASHEKNPLFGKVPEVARDIVHAIDTKASEAYVPRIWGMIMPVVKRTPEPIFQRFSFLAGR